MMRRSTSRALIGRQLLGAVMVAGMSVATAVSSQPIDQVDPTSRARFDGERANDLAGSTLATGDFNGDGIDDLAIAAPNVDRDEAVNAGRVYVVFGQAGVRSGLELAQLLDSENAGASLGFVISGIDAEGFIGETLGVVDINNDGIDDLVVGSPDGSVPAAFMGTFGLTEGAAYVLFGRRDGFDQMISVEELAAESEGSRRGFLVVGIQPFGRLSASISEVGDFNGDGLNDALFSGAHEQSSGTSATQPAQGILLFGRASDASWPAIVQVTDARQTIAGGEIGTFVAGRVARDESGLATSGVHDYNADGLDDFLFSAASGNEGRGEVLLVTGRQPYDGDINLTDLTSSGVQARFLGASDDVRIGTAIVDLGDFNGDAIADFAIAAPDSSDLAGRVYVVHGRSAQNIWSGDRSLDQLVAGGTALRIDGSGDERLGVSIASAGDVNGDGLSDLLIGTFDDRVFVVAGRTEPGTVFAASDALQVINGVAGVDDLFGREVAGNGDFDGDGSSDLVISAGFSSFSGNRTGSAFVVFGDGEDQTPRLNGSNTHAWYDRELPGQGVLVEYGTLAGEPAMFAAWYTFIDGEPAWLTTNLQPFSSPDRTVTSELFITRGGMFGAAFDPALVQIEPWGTVTATLTECDRLLWEYERDSDGHSGRLIMIPVLPDLLARDACGERSRNPDVASRGLIGTYWNASRAGEGILLDIEPGDDASTLFFSWFTYTPDGRQTWLVGSAPLDAADASVSVDLLIGSGAQFGQDFDPEDVTLTAWGTARLEFAGCSSAQLSYSGSFDGGSTREEGAIELVRFTEGLHAFDCTAAAALGDKAVNRRHPKKS